uniref:Xylulose kinase-1 n=1 Tax=Tanacetum cinerariifolium TaxID=118510 RepID=A0A6L2JXE0_TANCI|nr:hypothetical protein [Tanacetum cinerariifolium]
MATPTFTETHNLITFLEKPTESDGFEQIVDYLNANPIKYALIVSPMIYTSCIKQFWTSAKVKTVNEDVRLQALVDGKKVLEGMKKKRTYGLKRRMNEEDLFRVHDLDGDEVIVDIIADENVEQDATFAKKETLIEIKAAKPRARGVTAQEPSEFRTTSSLQSSQLPQAKDKAQMKAKIEEEERIAREKVEANIDVVEQWDKAQAKIDADINLAQKLQKIVEERSKKTQVEVTEGSSKRARDEIEQESAKRQRLEKEDDTAELKRCMEIVLEDDDDVTIKATPLSSKSPTMVDYKIYKEGKKGYFKIIRADGNLQNYLTFGTMFKNFNRKDLEVFVTPPDEAWTEYVSGGMTLLSISSTKHKE